MTQIYANNFTTLVLGRRGENLARKVVFDIRDLESLYGTGDVEVIYQRPCDAQPYPLTVQREGTIVTWDVTSTDTEMSDGSGKCELRYYVGETLAKSKTWRTWVEPAMGTPSETTPPEPEKGWVDKVLEAGAAAEEAAMAAQDAQAKAEEASKAFDEALDEAERAAEAEANRNVWEAYDEAKAYQTMNKVSWNGASYLCKQPCQGIDPSDADYWLLIADKGRDGIVEDGSGLYGFHIDDNGCLILTYEGDTPPDFVINEQGELIANLDGNKTLNIGVVRGTAGRDNLPNVETLAGAEQSIELAYNVEYRCADALTALTITGFGAPTESGKAALYSIVFTASADGVTVTLPDTIVWAVAEPVFAAGCTYWLTMTELGGKYLAVWVEVPANG